MTHFPNFAPHRKQVLAFPPERATRTPDRVAAEIAAENARASEADAAIFEYLVGVVEQWGWEHEKRWRKGWGR